MRKVVVLPQPEGPSSVTRRAGLDGDGHFLDRGDGAELLAHLLQHHGGGAVGDAHDAASRAAGVVTPCGVRAALLADAQLDQADRHQHEDDQDRE